MSATLNTAQNAARPAPRAAMSKYFILLFALLPIVPMPIAGGTPIAVSLMVLMMVGLFVSGRRFQLDKFDWIIFSVAGLLLLLEGVSVIAFDTPEDLNYFFGRAYWIALLIVTILVTNSELQRGHYNFIPKVLFWGAVFLVSAMAIESAFFPQFQLGRNFGSFSLPWPRATGVPNSDGKLGTFLCICLGTFLFFRPKLPLWQYLGLGAGAILGLAFTQSRSTLVAMGVVVGVFWLYRSLDGRSASLWLVRAFTLALGSIFLIVAFQELLSGIVGEGIFERNAMARVSHVGYGLQVISGSPFFGAGADAITQYDQYSGIHNTFLAMSVKSGLMAGGLAIYLILAPIFHLSSTQRQFAANSAICLGILTEHMLYPGLVNEFIIISFLAAKSFWYRRQFPQSEA